MFSGTLWKKAFYFCKGTRATFECEAITMLEEARAALGTYISQQKGTVLIHSQVSSDANDINQFHLDVHQTGELIVLHGRHDSALLNITHLRQPLLDQPIN